MHSSVLLLSVLLCCTSAYKNFQTKIPNGDSVPHPCKPNYTWQGVGHKNVQGGGERNPFGKDFENNGKVWDKTLCEKDSDGDGKTNGAELGDPNCVWTEGAQPEVTSISSLSHPGICEPFDSPACQAKNNWEINCDTEEFKCDAINDTDVKNVTLRFKHTKVPAQETSYNCMVFDLPTDGDYHMIASEPFINNSYVMHHIVVFGCPDTVTESSTEPYQCGMQGGDAGAGCREMIDGWTLGSAGSCLPNKMGIRIGKNGYKRVMFQIHWNNPLAYPDYYDSSGLILHYIPASNARKDAGMLVVGQRYLAIPPIGQSGSTTFTSLCSSDCTNALLQEKMYIGTVGLHMHYHGKSAKLEQFRNNALINTVADIQVYNYDSPVQTSYSEGLEFRPGDELKLTCDFKNSKSGTFTYWGEDTSSEMCFAFISYYPHNKNFTSCIDYKNKHFCDVRQQQLKDEAIVLGGCNFTKLVGMMNNMGSGGQLGQIDPNTQSTMTNLLSVRQRCTKDSCTSDCKAAVMKLQEGNKCFETDNVGILSFLSRRIPQENENSPQVQKPNAGGSRMADLIKMITKCSQLVVETPESAANIVHVSLVSLGIISLSHLML